MDSMPPASMISLTPSCRDWVAKVMAFMPEAQTLLMVVASVVSGHPAPRATCLAGAWPNPAERTLPINTSSMSLGERPDRSMAARAATVPRAGVVALAKEPRKDPTGVRADQRVRGRSGKFVKGREGRVLFARDQLTS